LRGFFRWCGYNFIKLKAKSCTASCAAALGFCK